jgi:hypothetical protein
MLLFPCHCLTSTPPAVLVLLVLQVWRAGQASSIWNARCIRSLHQLTYLVLAAGFTGMRNLNVRGNMHTCGVCALSMHAVVVLEQPDAMKVDMHCRFCCVALNHHQCLTKTLPHRQTSCMFSP